MIAKTPKPPYYAVIFTSESSRVTSARNRPVKDSGSLFLTGKRWRPSGTGNKMPNTYLPSRRAGANGTATTKRGSQKWKGTTVLKKASTCKWGKENKIAPVLEIGTIHNKQISI
jgi:hypothetical protein